jgi:hypothetical protein
MKAAAEREEEEEEDSFELAEIVSTNNDYVRIWAQDTEEASFGKLEGGLG